MLYGTVSCLSFSQFQSQGNSLWETLGRNHQPSLLAHIWLCFSVSTAGAHHYHSHACLLSVSLRCVLWKWHRVHPFLYQKADCLPMGEAMKTLHLMCLVCQVASKHWRQGTSSLYFLLCMALHLSPFARLYSLWTCNGIWAFNLHL